jgi:polar amino acid transport system substrate-binding protein
MTVMLRVAVQPDLPPYQFIDSRGRVVGAHIDILNNIAKRYNMQVEYVPMPSYTACFEALESEQVDVVLGAHPGIRHNVSVRTTTIISSSQVCLIAPDNRAREIRENLGTGYYHTAFEDGLVEYFSLRNFRNLHARVVPNQRETVKLLLDGKVDMIVGVKNSLVYQIEEAGLEQDYTIINNYLVPIEYSMAVRSKDSTLLYQLNSGISQTRISGEYEKIHEKWIQPEEAQLRKLVRTAGYTGAALSCVVGAVLLVNLRVNSVLKRQIELRTQELSEANERLQQQIIEIRNMNELRNQIVEDNPNGIIVFDTDFTITACNHNACEIIGRSTPPIGESILDVELLHPLIERKRDQWFAPDVDLNMDDITTRDDKGETVIYRCDIRRLNLSEGGVRGIILSIKNVTRERKNRELFYERERNRALNQMVAGIAHEIRNPLTSIKAFVELIPKKKDSPQFQEQMARYLPEELDRINSMVRNLIDYAKPQSSKRQQVDVHEVITSCGSMIGYSISPHIELELKADEGLVIEANPSQLRQIMINLILNAAEAMQDRIIGSSQQRRLRLQVRAFAEGDEVVITVRDEGCGMSAFQLERACEPYFTTKPEGTGLGLAVSKQYAEENGGTLSIASKEGKFTEVTIRFKRCEA